MKKRILAAFIAVSALMLTGCGADENLTTEDSIADTAVSETQEETSVSETSENITEAAESQTSSEAVSETETVAVTSAETAAKQAETEKATGVSIASLNGAWKNDAEYPDTLVFDNGQFYLVSGYTGMMVTGEVKIEAGSDSESSSHSYVLYDGVDGSVAASFPVTGEIPFNELKSSGSSYFSDDNSTFSREESVARDPESAVDFLGDWKGPRPHIQIAPLDSGYEVMVFWSSSAWDNTVWTYNCQFSDTSKTLVCDGGATCVNIHTDDSGSTEETVFTDGSGEFTVKYGLLFWNDHDLNSGAGYVFTK